jgi:hypothetical protein
MPTPLRERFLINLVSLKNYQFSKTRIKANAFLYITAK